MTYPAKWRFNNLILACGVEPPIPQRNTKFTMLIPSRVPNLSLGYARNIRLVFGLMMSIVQARARRRLGSIVRLVSMEPVLTCLACV